MRIEHLKISWIYVLKCEHIPSQGRKAEFLAKTQLLSQTRLSSLRLKLLMFVAVEESVPDIARAMSIHVFGYIKRSCRYELEHLILKIL